MVTILANLKINHASKLKHLRDSFWSFNKISDNWLINVRGPYRKEALKFLRQHLGTKMIQFNLLDDKRGWINNALEMLQKAKHDYILIWNEDHINTAPQSIYKQISNELKKNKIDYFPISWWHFGNYKKGFTKLNIREGVFMDYLTLDKKSWIKMKLSGHQYYLISLLGIFNKSFLVNMISKDRLKLPPVFSKIIFGLVSWLNKLGFNLNPQDVFQNINSFVAYRLSRYSVETPFEIEKDSSRYDILPLKMGISKRELFASIDDDQGVYGYSLISRGFYKDKALVRNQGSN